MAAVHAQCPEEVVLRQFALGRMTPEEVEHMAEHVEQCSRCAQRLESTLCEDPLVDAMAAQTPAPVQTERAAVDQLIAHLKELAPAPATATEAATLQTTDATPYSGSTPLSGAVTAEALDDTCDFLGPAQGPDELGSLGGYRVKSVLGSGGMGVVFLAEDPDLKRLVALKTMRPALAASASARQRFLREAQVTASIAHDHIVHIYRVGEEHGVPFLAMQLLRGETLEQRLKRDMHLPPAEVLRLGCEIAEGLAAAHAVGLIHRDIKPSNLWLEGERQRVKVLDFGLARACSSEARLTQPGAITGTPAYMAPEQAQGLATDARCDLFSLGCVLYRAATGKLPFKGESTTAVLLSLVQDEPTPPHQLVPEVPVELSQLIQRLLAKNPDERPASAHAVLEELLRLRHNLDTTHALSAVRAPAQPVAGRPRRRWLVALAAALVLLAGAAAAIVVLKNKHGTLTVTATEPGAKVFVNGEEKLTLDAGDAGKIDLVPGEHRLVVKYDGKEVFTRDFRLERNGQVIIDAHWEPLKKGPPLEPVVKRILGPLDHLDPAKVPEEERLEELPAGRVAVLGEHRLKHHAGVASVAWSPDGKRIVSSGLDGVAQVWNAATLRRQAMIPLTNVGWLLVFHPDGSTLNCLYPTTASLLRSIDFTGEKPSLGPPLKLNVAIGLVAFSADRKAMATSSKGQVTVWDLTGKEPRQRTVLETGKSGHSSLALSADGSILAVGGVREVRLWDVQGEAKDRGTVPADKGTVYGLAFAPNGKTLAATADSGVYLMDLTGESPRPGPFLPCTSTSRLADFSPDGKLLAVSGYHEGFVDLFDVADLAHAKKRDCLKSLSAPSCMIFSPDSRALVHGAADGCLHVWEVTESPARKRSPLRGHVGPVLSLVFTAADHKLLSSTAEGFLRSWSFGAEGIKEGVTPLKGAEGCRLVLTGQGKHVAVSGSPKIGGGIWDIEGTTARQRWLIPKRPGMPPPPYLTSLTPRGDRMAFSVSGSKEIRVVDLTGAKPRELPPFKLDKQVSSIALSPDGRWLACGCYLNKTMELLLWDLSTRPTPKAYRFSSTQTYWIVTFSPDSRILVAAGVSPGLRLFDVGGPSPTTLVTTQTGSHWNALAFSPDGKYLAGSDLYGNVSLFDTTASLRKTRDWKYPYVAARSLAFAEDGRHLAVGKGDGTIDILRLSAPGKPEAATAK